MVFGIDLGTTNSLIGIGDDLLTGLVSSNVDIEKKKQVPRDDVSENIVSSYKTNMSIGEEGKLSIQCSAIILKDLAKTAERRYGEVVKDVVVSVPAYFSTSQREAVYKAAEIAGLNLKSLINEPTAAALYVGKGLKDLVVVYDLGGGTFDVSVVDSRMGNYSVIATDGIIKGGDDLDNALVDELITVCKIPIRFRTKGNRRKMNQVMRNAKETIQKTGEDVYISLKSLGLEYNYTLTLQRYKELVREVFEETIDMTNFVISNNIPACEKPKIVFVGGSTNCPYLKQMVLEEIELEEIVTNINPDLIVAKGVAIYAKLLNDGLTDEFVEDVTKRLCIEDSNGRSLTIIESNSIVPCKNSIMVCNANAGKTLSLRLYQGSSLIASNNDYIGTLVYQYENYVEANEGYVEVTAEVSVDGVISLSAYEVLYGQEYTQGIKLTNR